MGTPEDAGEKKLYRYESAWKDCLTYYSDYGETMAYTGGNPNNYHGYSLRWEKGRQLKSMTKTGSNISFEYNASGVRAGKTVNGVVHNYCLNGTNILLETIERGAEVDVLEYIYDGNGEIGGLRYNGETYVYIRNLQGDVIRMVDSTGKDVVKYVYDAWGKAEKIQDGNGLDIGSDAGHIGNINPIRYRGYYYDQDTKLYYLNTRYYSPEWRRFISPDDTAYLDFETPNGLNLYVYCGNNPVMNVDPNGTFILSTLVVGIAAGLIVGGISGGIKAKIDGTNLIGGILAGALIGAATGLAFSLGGIAGAAIKGTIHIVGLTISQTVALTVSTAVGMNLIAGMGAYAIETVTNNRDFSIGGMLVAGGKQAGEGMINYITGGIMSASGFWKLGAKMPKTHEYAKLLNYRPSVLSELVKIGNSAINYVEWAIFSSQGPIFRAIAKFVLQILPKQFFD